MPRLLGIVVEVLLALVGHPGADDLIELPLVLAAARHRRKAWVLFELGLPHHLAGRSPALLAERHADLAVPGVVEGRGPPDGHALCR